MPLVEKKKKQNRKYTTKTLVRRAIKNGFKSEPGKGLKYLKDCDLGDIVSTSLSKAILIEIGSSSCTVIVVEWSGYEETSDSYLGKQNWAPNTEVKIKEEI